jgi:hypothetical protein
MRSYLNTVASHTVNGAAPRRTQVGDTTKAQTKSVLSVWRAVVVQFRETSNGSRRVWQGRVEHIASGRWTTFTSRAQLLAFLSSILPRDGDE